MFVTTMSILLLAAGLMISDPVRGAMISLDGPDWHLTNGSVSCAAEVPGSVPTALFKAGLTPDPQFGYNQLKVFADDTTFTYNYSKSFKTPVGGCRAPGRCELVFDGIDTAASVYVNNQQVGKTNDMHLRFMFDVSHVLQAPGSGVDNTVVVVIEPATAYARAQAIKNDDPQCKKFERIPWAVKWGRGTECNSYIRKNTGSFGWDCAPAYVSQGIWRSVWIRSFDSAVIDTVAPMISGTVDPDTSSTNQFNVEVRIYMAVSAAVQAKITVTGGWTQEVSHKTVQLTPTASGGAQLVVLNLSATNVLLWWPNGHGPSNQTMFPLTVTCQTMSGEDVSTQKQMIGFRTFEFVGSVGNNTDTFGSATLYFKVNGRPLFSKGNNWMPVTVFPADDSNSQQLTVDRLMDEVAVGGNTIRVWGGGIYESKTFYDTADQLGLMILQDGSFFGSYPQDDDFLKLVTDEITYNARRLAPHPSLCVYSGNNEQSVFENIELFVNTQLATMQAENTNVRLYPSCPSNGWDTLSPLVPRQIYKDPIADKIPPVPVCQENGVAKECPHDNHYYGPCGTIPQGTNFGSEFGWPSADIMSVSDTFTPKGLNILNVASNGSTFLNYRSQIKNPDWTFESMPVQGSTLSTKFPTLIANKDNTSEGLERWLYLTQALQTLCVGGSFASYRQHDTVFGALNWAINSIWLGPAWGSISHDGSWKMLHYKLSSLFKDEFLSFVDYVPPVAIAQGAAPSSCDQDQTCLHLSNHGHDKVVYSCELKVHDYVKGAMKHLVLFNATVAAMSGLPLPTYQTDTLLTDASCVDKDGIADRSLCFFTAQCRNVDSSEQIEADPFFPANLSASNLKPAGITAHARTSDMKETSTISIELTTNTTTPYTFLSSTVPGVFSDNSFTLLPSQTKVLSFTPKSPCTASDFRSSTRIYVLNNFDPVTMWESEA